VNLILSLHLLDAVYFESSQTTGDEWAFKLTLHTKIEVQVI
jgi:hypothetical protein